MASAPGALKDDVARLTATNHHHRSLLVEAGAGSGKTAVMSGRIAMMLAEGIAPKHIAAVTFTELAASELLQRVREFTDRLLQEDIPAELRVALPNGLSAAQRSHLATASGSIDEITCSTIHGFCQHLIKPYPAEADIDPGATIIDPAQADLAFSTIVDDWLREYLDGTAGSLLSEMVLQDAKATVDLVHLIAGTLRARPDVQAPAARDLALLAAGFQSAVGAFADFMRGAGVSQPETEIIVAEFEALAARPLQLDDSALPQTLASLLTLELSAKLATQAGTFRSYRNKGKWESAAKAAGLSKADAAQLNTSATDRYTDSCTGWTTLLDASAAQALAILIGDIRQVLERYNQFKRNSAQLDFDDLIFKARDLLRNHEAERKALGERYQRVLVDEFQDTDPMQAEIFWRLCGDPPNADADWRDYRIRPGALFLVGDPKQAIYRFRGADVQAYVHARETIKGQEADSLLAISTNFRSRASILSFVNAGFAAPLAADGQPGFTALDAFHEDPESGPCVAALDYPVMFEGQAPTAADRRDAEAEAVANLCASLIQNRVIYDAKQKQQRPCRPGDIALLAPTGTDLWRYEEALEERGIPVATQAGKGLYRRQEIQDLIALTRILANRRDALALGALLRGPLVGLTERELLDIVAALPRNAEKPDRIPQLNLTTEAIAINHPLAREVIEKLQSLARRANNTTPHDLLSQAMDQFRVRPILWQRHRGQAERALANVDLYLSMAVAYEIRGLQSFAETMTAAWEDASRAVEGRPDAQETAVALFTMHAAKGLEWPIVIPINTNTAIKGAENAVVDRRTNTFYCKVLGVPVEGHEDAVNFEDEELDRERVRLWYVATTRARELLVLPRSDIDPPDNSWIGVLGIDLRTLPALELPLGEPSVIADGTANEQTREVFVAQAGFIAARQLRIVRKQPNLAEGEDDHALQEDAADAWLGTSTELPPTISPYAEVQGGRERGLILHKLMEEILNGETADDKDTLLHRAGQLILDLNRTPTAEPVDGLNPQELAGCVLRTLALPEIAALRPRLLAEFPVYGSEATDGEEMVTSGIADALTLSENGTPEVVVDWKSDVSPTADILSHYRNQVRTYLDITLASRGLIVLMTTGNVLAVSQNR